MRSYENPQKTSENRLKPRSFYIPDGSAKKYKLNGEWRFQFFENGDAAGETITRKIGFRTVSISADNELLINGKPVKLKGVNHHDTT